MNIEGLDYNSQRPQMKMSEYGREIQMMVEHAMTLPTKEERQACAETIITTMKRLTQSTMRDSERMYTLWNHLALLSNGQLDIDYPVEITSLEAISTKPEHIEYPDKRVPIRHYGKAMFQVFEHLKTMEPGEERDELIHRTANQMKRCLMLYGLGNSDHEKIADDLARFTDGNVQIDVRNFRFESVDIHAIQAQLEMPKKKKKRKK